MLYYIHQIHQPLLVASPGPPAIPFVNGVV